jgi:predicted dehydrogenase
MKFLVIGLGSMGKRRVRNLQKNNECDIIGFDTRKDRAVEASNLYEINTFTTFEEAINQKPEIFIISCPPDKHLQYATYAIEHEIHFFSEVNTSAEKEMNQLIQKMENKKIVAVPSCTMRFHPCIKIVKEIIEQKTIGNPLLLTYHSGSNLEDWHPWENVTDYYVGKKETGGGRDQIMFELEWIVWLLGNVKTVRALTTKLSDTKADIFDVYNLILEFENGSISNILVDVIQRPPGRVLKIICQKGIIQWDWMEHIVKIYDTNDKKWTLHYEKEGYDAFPVEEMYEKEILQFILALKNKEKFPTNFKQELKILKIMHQAEKNSEENFINID